MQFSKKVPSLLATMLTLMLALALFPASPSLAADPLPDPVQRIYERNDKAVVDAKPGASWLWGPRIQDNAEDYQESPGGKRSVYYFEKGRLEINNPGQNPNDPYYVTSGLLLREMITGRVQTGDNATIERGPANVQLAGDLQPGLADSPTYASLVNLVSFDGSFKSNNLTGQPVILSLRLGGQVAGKPELAQGVTHSTYYPQTGHNVASVFMEFMNRRGSIYENGRYLENQPLFDPLYIFGYPISEPYWTRVTVAGQAKDVLVQAFERRLLTYTPTNPDPYKVELGNLGLAYVQWRYKSTPPKVTVTEPDAPRPTETEGFKLYNTANNTMRTLSSVKRTINQGGEVVGEQFFQAPNKARALEQVTVRGENATAETIIVGSRNYQRLIINGEAGGWVFTDRKTPYSWPTGFSTFKPLSLNDLSYEWVAGARTPASGDTLRQLNASVGLLDGTQYSLVRTVSENSNRLTATGLQSVAPTGAKLSQKVDYRDYNVPNAIVAPANATPASVSAGQDTKIAGTPLTRSELLSNEWLTQLQEQPTSVTVKFKSSLSLQSGDFQREMSQLRLSNGWESRIAEGRAVVMELNGADLKQTLTALQADPRVEYAQPNYRRKLEITQFSDPRAKDQYYLNTVKMPRAWDFSTGSKNIMVALIDSGADLNNPDMKGTITDSYNPATKSSNVTDIVGHGSWTAAIIGATGNNNVYGTGIAWNSRVMVVQATDEDGSLLDSSIEDGVRYATDKGARVINMSLGGNGEEARVLCEGVEYAVKRNVVVVTSSGNDGSNGPHYPSDCPGVISVGATGLLNQPASFSNFGSRVTLSAPGVRICGAVTAGKFGCSDGTSASTPIVAAAAALVLSINPNLKADEVKAILYASATPAPGKVSGQRDDYYGYGLVNIGAAVRLAATNQIPPLPKDLP